MQEFIGKQIDRYHITERLGIGGMAVVYKAYDMRLEREVALKLIRADAIPAEQHERLMKRFEREAKSQARFSHPNIISVHDYGEIDGAPYLVMEFIPGGTLKARIKGPTDYRQAFGWLIPIADALQYAHEQHTIHRDIKPSNILFGENDRPILTDFGIAKILETDEATLTGTGLGVGTPEYMAPEQWQGQASPATDQYALGVVLYELLTGQKPYTADTPVAVALLQMSEPLRSPRSLVPGIPEPVEKLLYKALAKDPQDRYEDIEAFRKALKKQLIGISGEHGASGENAENLIESMEETSLPTTDSEAETVDIIEPISVKASSITTKQKYKLSHKQIETKSAGFPKKDSNKRHYKQRFWQIIVPVGLGFLLIFGIIILVISRANATAAGGQVSQWADVSLIWLYLPILLLGFVLVTILIGLIYFLSRLYKLLPGLINNLIREGRAYQTVVVDDFVLGDEDTVQIAEEDNNEMYQIALEEEPQASMQTTAERNS